jgi:hypothetical protein
MELPNEILFYIFKSIKLKTQLNFSSCCKQMLFLRSYIRRKKYLTIKDKKILRPDWIENIVIDEPISLNEFKNIKLIQFRYSFNEPVDNLPKNLKVIRFGSCFNHPVNHLPKNLEKIRFGYSFNKPVNNLPKNLKKIRFGCSFNHPIDNLPKNLEKVRLRSNFIHSFELPKGCKLLTY